MYLTILYTYGRYPEFEDQPIVTKAINGYYGHQDTNVSTNTPDTLSKKAILGIDGITQFVLYYWPFALGNKDVGNLTRLHDYIGKCLDDESYRSTFFSYFGETSHLNTGRNSLIPLKSSQCLFIPKYANVCERFPYFLDGTQGVSDYIPERLVEFDKPKKKPKKPKKSGSKEIAAAESKAPPGIEVIEIAHIAPASPKVVASNKNRRQDEAKSPSQSSPASKRQKVIVIDPEVSNMNEKLSNILGTNDDIFTKDNNSLLLKMKDTVCSATESIEAVSQDPNYSIASKFIQNYVGIVPLYQTQIAKYSDELKKCREQIEMLSTKLSAQESGKGSKRVNLQNLDCSEQSSSQSGSGIDSNGEGKACDEGNSVDPKATNQDLQSKKPSDDNGEGQALMNKEEDPKSKEQDLQSKKQSDDNGEGQALMNKQEDPKSKKQHPKSKKSDMKGNKCKHTDSKKTDPISSKGQEE